MFCDIIDLLQGECKFELGGTYDWKYSNSKSR